MKFEEIINFSNYSLIFALYLMIGVNFLIHVFSCHIQKVLQNNMYVKHLVAIFTLFFFVILIKNEKTDDEYLYFKNMLSTLCLYFIFICSLRMKMKFFIIFMTILCINFFIRGYIDSLNPILFKDKIAKLEQSSRYLIISSVIVIIIGIIFYYLETKKKYDKEFTNKMFIIGDKNCKKYKI
jgi:hypothetical protein